MSFGLQHCCTLRFLCLRLGRLRFGWELTRVSLLLHFQTTANKDQEPRINESTLVFLRRGMWWRGTSCIAIVIQSKAAEFCSGVVAQLTGSLPCWPVPISVLRWAVCARKESSALRLRVSVHCNAFALMLLCALIANLPNSNSRS